MNSVHDFLYPTGLDLGFSPFMIFCSTWGNNPPDIKVRDLFLINASEGVVVVLELTCPWDSNIIHSHEYKQENYAFPASDLKRGFIISYS